MLTHEQIWRAIDRLATTFGYSPSGLAKQAGLDPTSFNKSKRIGPDGKPRWPSTESVSRVLGATGATMSDFISFVEDSENESKATSIIPAIELTQIGKQENFSEEGIPQGNNWNEINFPEQTGGNAYSLKVNNNSLEPTYRKGDVLIVSLQPLPRNNDRVIFKTTDGQIRIKEIIKKSGSSFEFKSLDIKHENEKILLEDIAWTAKILWVSQ